jgi:hypothetical protein
MTPQMLVLYRDTKIEFWTPSDGWCRVRESAGWQELGAML